MLLSTEQISSARMMIPVSPCAKEENDIDKYDLILTRLIVIII